MRLAVRVTWLTPGVATARFDASERVPVELDVAAGTVDVAVLVMPLLCMCFSSVFASCVSCVCACVAASSAGLVDAKWDARQEGG